MGGWGGGGWVGAGCCVQQSPGMCIFELSSPIQDVREDSV